MLKVPEALRPRPVMREAIWSPLPDVTPCMLNQPKEFRSILRSKDYIAVDVDNLIKKARNRSMLFSSTL